jgi:hypothetical protein
VRLCLFRGDRVTALKTGQLIISITLADKTTNDGKEG